MAREYPLEDEALLDRFQKAAFGYFLEQINPDNGLVADTSRAGAPVSIAVVGFALACYPVGVERGWIGRAEAAERALRTLNFFYNSVQSDEPHATGYKGFYYHFLDRNSGTRVWESELSLIDTTLLLAGALTAAAYFGEDTARERNIRERVEALYRRIDWQWARGGATTVRQGWKPESGFLHYGWEGYSEASILYVLGLASPTHPLSDDAFHGWRETYQWENIYDCELLYSGPLFIHHYSHAWIDFAGIHDRFMRAKHSDYFQNTQRAVWLQREYARRNPHDFVGYGEHCWGLTASDGPGPEVLSVAGRERRFLGYAARGVPFGPDDGTLDPCSALASVPFAPQAALAALRHCCEHYPHIVRDARLPSGFNPSYPGGWVSEGYYGLDQGLLVLMIENHRSRLIWQLMRACPYIRTGLKRAGFNGGWLA